MFRRKNYFIKKSFQTKFFLRFIALILAESLIIAGFFVYLSSQTLTAGYHGSDFTIAKTSNFFLTTFVAITVLVGVAVGIAGAFVFTFFSHSLAGPLYRFESVLRAFSEGDLRGRVNLRKTDQLSELQDALNKAIDSADKRISEIKKDVKTAGELSSGDAKDAASSASIKLEFYKTT